MAVAERITFADVSASQNRVLDNRKRTSFGETGVRTESWTP